MWENTGSDGGDDQAGEEGRSGPAGDGEGGVAGVEFGDHGGGAFVFLSFFEGEEGWLIFHILCGWGGWTE